MKFQLTIDIIFTSQSAVKFGSKILNLEDLSKSFEGEIYSIGPATSLELQKRGINPIVAQSYNSEGLLEVIRNKSRQKSVVLWQKL